MKRWIAILLALAISSGCIGCADQTDSTPTTSTEAIKTTLPETDQIETQSAEDSTVRIGNIEFALDSEMSAEEYEENLYSITLIDGSVGLAVYAGDISSLTGNIASTFVAIQHKTMTADADHSNGVTEVNIDICDFPASGEAYVVAADNGATAYIDVSFTDTYYAYTLRYLATVANSDEVDEIAELFTDFLANATYVGETPRDLESSDTPTDSDDKTTAINTPSLGEQNALKSAQSYLKYSAFSYTGLINQLEYEGYTTEEATYAVNNCGADWKEQALECAKNYLEYSAFSYAGLIDQLEYEGFTNEEATYGVDNCEADWNEQAVKCAKNYLDFSAFSRQGLIDQLVYEGFTNDQAVYGVEQNGL